MHLYPAALIMEAWLTAWSLSTLTLAAEEAPLLGQPPASKGGEQKAARVVPGTDVSQRRYSRARSPRLVYSRERRVVVAGHDARHGSFRLSLQLALTTIKESLGILSQGHRVCRNALFSGSRTPAGGPLEA